MSTREGWDRVFSRLDENSVGEDAWLERWWNLLEPDRDAPILDLGCGAGEDTRSLTRWGFRVVAADFSDKALEATRKRAPRAETKNVDLTRGLPFHDDLFRVIIASLSLHYFPWLETVRILEEVRRCLAPDGYLLVRLNSTRDDHYAPADKEEIEPNFYLVDGYPKRLFDRQGVDALFATGWRVLNVEERATKKYGSQKTLWEIVAKSEQVPRDKPEKSDDSQAPASNRKQ